MSYETIITIACVLFAAFIILDSFNRAHGRNRAEAAERWAYACDRREQRWYREARAATRALARIEATIAACEAEVIQ